MSEVELGGSRLIEWDVQVGTVCLMDDVVVICRGR